MDFYMQDPNGGSGLPLELGEDLVELFAELKKQQDKVAKKNSPKKPRRDIVFDDNLVGGSVENSFFGDDPFADDGKK